MTEFLFQCAPARSVAVRGESGEYPVNRIFCVGRNYVAHAVEMGAQPERDAPFYFTKSSLAFEPGGVTVPYPPGTDNYQYEVELVVFIGAPAFRIDTETARAAVYGYACGLDMTRRDLQLAGRKKGRPWDLGKDFEQSAIIAQVTKAGEFGEIRDQEITLAVNGEMRQEARLSDLIWSVDELVADLSAYYHLVPGDAIMTGTPAGVGAVHPGDSIVGRISGLAPVELRIDVQKEWSAAER